MQRFAHLPVRHSASIYAVELSNGWVKVGYTNGVRERMKGITWDAKRWFDCDVLRCLVFVGAGGFRREQKCLLHLRESGVKQAFKNEYFESSFDDVVFLVRAFIGVKPLNHVTVLAINSALEKVTAQ
jgi:hypothetical protein